MKLGDSYVALGQASNAAAAYQRACALDQNSVPACVGSAAALLAMGDYATAAVGSALGARGRSLQPRCAADSRQRAGRRSPLRGRRGASAGGHRGGAERSSRLQGALNGAAPPREREGGRGVAPARDQARTVRPRTHESASRSSISRPDAPRTARSSCAPPSMSRRTI